MSRVHSIPLSSFLVMDNIIHVTDSSSSLFTQQQESTLPCNSLPSRTTSFLSSGITTLVSRFSQEERHRRAQWEILESHSPSSPTTPNTKHTTSSCGSVNSLASFERTDIIHATDSSPPPCPKPRWYSILYRSLRKATAFVKSTFEAMVSSFSAPHGLHGAEFGKKRGELSALAIANEYGVYYGLDLEQRTLCYMSEGGMHAIKVDAIFSVR